MCLQAPGTSRPQGCVGLGQSEHFLPFTGAWQAGHGNPEPDKQHLCSRLDPCQAASFPGADLMFLKSLKTPEVCVFLSWFSTAASKGNGPGWGLGATWRGGHPEPKHLTTQTLPCPACGMQAPFQKKRKIHCLSSEMRPLLLCLPAPNHLKVPRRNFHTQAFLSVSVRTSGSGTKGSQTSSSRGTKHISEVG